MPGAARPQTGADAVAASGWRSVPGEQTGRTHTHSRTTYGNTYASDGSDSTPVDVVVATWDLTTVEPE